ncbi:hypothetical protein ED733_000145 [Metarhizium rileyi]|uniref:B30.2/SPRY domain-containing protein n=1 Tax=Metarhizium rileyi (strain RCEF 4871) TaxID=1649241 RepID=A0A5C6GE55_METRR|nr:hypothetical protein ED733_000145 [Metarhizium rileyi]
MAVALDDISWNVPLPDNIGDLIRKDIVGDLTRIVAPLVKSENNRLYLIHDTLWDFLQERFSQVADPARGSEAVLGTPQLTHKHVSGDMHYRILVQCLEYSGNLGPSDSTSVPLKHAWLSFPVDEKNGLLSYAPFYWPRHYLKTSSREAAHAYVLQFFRNDEMFEKWSNLYQHFKSQTQSNRDRLDHPLKVVCSFGLADLFEDCFTMVRSSERHGNQLSESLDLAARRGYGDMVRMLLERGVRSQNALGNAALEGYDDIVDNLLDAGSNVNEVDGSGFAPIHYATCSGHKRTVALLLAKGADPNALTTLPQDRVMLPYETSPIDQTQEGDISDTSSEFSESSDTVTSEQSLVQTENVVYRHRAGAETSLHFAALTGQVEIAQLLLANGAKVDAQNDFEYDPLKFAAEGGFPELLTLLLDNQAAADNESGRDGNTAMHLAVACGHSKAAEILLARSSNAFKLIHKVNTEGLSPMHIVARDGRLKLLSLMLRVEDRHREADSVSSVNSNSQSASPVAISPAGMRITHRAHTGQQPIRRSTFGRPPERKGPLGGGDTQIFSVDKKHCKSVLELAAQNGHPRIVHKLLKRSWLVGTQDIGRALVLAAEQGHANIVTALLDRNSSKAASDTSKALALHAAAKAGHPKTVEALLTHRRGPRLSEMDKVASKGMTPLHEAAKGGHADVVKTLLEHKGTPNDLDDSLRTALHYAAASGSLECVQVLLQTAYKVDGRLRDKRGRTALHFAARRGHLPIVRRLCQVKDMIWTKDRDDLTACDWVVDRDIPEEVETFIRILEDTAGQGAEFERGGLPLHVTVERRNISILRLLLQKGWKCNTRDTKGVTPFLKAVMKNFDEGVDLLLQDELCEVNARDDEDCNALHYVESPKLARKLLQLGVHNEHKDRKGQTPLFAAAWGSHIEVVRVIMESTPRPDPHIRDEDGWTVLHAAYDCPSILGLMLENKVDPNVLNSDGRTALAMSIEGDHFDCAKLLLEAQADPNLADEFENSPLCVAFTSTSCIEWLKLLSDNGVNLLAQSTSEITALHLAAEKNELELFTYLVERMESVDTTRVNEIFGSVLCHYVAMLDFNQVLADMLVGRGLDVNRKAKSQLADYELTALYAACRQGRSETVEWLLQHGADVNLLVGEGRSPLGASFRSLVDPMAKVYLLLAKEANVNHVGTMEPTALQQATSLGNKALITLLLDKGADPNLAGGQRDTPLNIAIRQKLGSDIVLSIISKGADLSQAGKHGILPAGTAAGADQVSILQLLAEKGVDPLAKDIHGRTALMHAVIGHSVDAVSYLLANKMISVSEVDAKGQTPLIVAAVLGDKAIVKVLLEKGFSDPKLLNAQDYRGKTALACAVSSNHLDVVVTLLGNDASPHVVDCRGRSPLYWAAREAGLEVMETMITSLDRKDHEITAYLNVALHGAVAAGRLEILQMLLKRDYVNVNHREPDGWSPLYTAQIYGRTTLVDKLRDARAFHSSEAPGVKMPSRWHLHDRFPALELGPEGTSLRTNGKFLNLELSNQCFGAARTDYPMVPLVDDIYYFEIQIRKASTEGTNVPDISGIAIGFCDDHAPLYDMLGWHTGSWGFHSRSGCLYANDERSWEGIPYSEPYGQGDVIGCGLNFAKRNGFYTRNGKVIGRSFPRAIGKLYPAVSMDICNGVWEISAVFPDADGRSARFMFQGSFGEETLRQVERKEWDNETPE